MVHPGATGAPLRSGLARAAPPRSDPRLFRKVVLRVARAIATMTFDASFLAHVHINPSRYPSMILPANARTSLAVSTAIFLAAATPSRAAERDGQHDFDFNFGTWKTHVSRLVHPLADSKTWTEYDGTSVVRTVWNGRASLFELDVQGPAGHIEGVGLRLYNPQSHQWNLNWTNSSVGMAREKRQRGTRASAQTTRALGEVI